MSSVQPCSRKSDRVIKKYKVEFAHSNQSFALSFYDTLSASASSAGWGIRDVKVYLTTCNYSCLKCSGVNDQCQTCGTNAELTATSFCQCCKGFYASSLTPFTCSQCHKTCKECSGCELDDCTKCKANAILLNGTCTCNAGYRMNDSGDCEACHFSCKECNGPQANQCKSCYCDGTLTSVTPTGGVCKCQPGFSQLPGLEFKCTKCHQSCVDCNKFNLNECVSCTANASLTLIDEDTTLCKCDGTYFAIQSNPLRCLPCSAGCKTCSTMFKCDSCFANADLVYGGNCVCKQGFFANANNPADCQPCSGNCKSCSTTSSTCTACTRNAYIGENSECKCFDGYYPYVDPVTHVMECRKCHSTCLKCSGGSDSDCTDCQSQSVLVSQEGSCTGKCQCSPKMYMVSSDPFTCLPCHPTCKTCNSNEENQCSTCFDGMTWVSSSNVNLLIGWCKCPVGTYFNDFLLECRPCGKFCGRCNGNDDPDMCLECAHPDTHLVDGICVVKPGKYEDCSGEIVDCDEHCDQCFTGGSNHCTACKGNLILLNGECVCPQGSFPDSTNPTTNCIPCANSCLTCDGPLCTDCLTCKENYTMNLTTGECEAAKDCVIVDASGKCVKCHMNCATCSDIYENSCTSCYDENQEVRNGMCLCKQGHYVTQNYPLKCDCCDEMCKNCSGSSSNQCTECFSHATLKQGQCVCDSGYYLDENQRCSKCNNTCAECFGCATECTKCTTHAGLVDGTCTCKNGYTFNPTNGLCEKCNDNCLRCSYQNKDICTACSDHAIVVGNKCVCVNGYFAVPSSVTLNCQPCHRTCATCLNDNSRTSCVSCRADFTFEKLSCDALTEEGLGKCKCSDGLYADPIDSAVCRQCDPNCKTCKGSPNNCTSCHSNSQIIVNGTCVCPDHTYQDSNGSCLPCHSTCGACSGCSENECITCRDGTFDLSDDDNTCSCPTHWVLNTSQSSCIECSDNCQTCDIGKPNECLSCYNDGIIDSCTKKCVCPPGKFLDSSGLRFMCRECHNNCQECYGGRDDQCLSCPDNAVLDSNDQCHCVAGYFDENWHCDKGLSCSRCSESCSTCEHTADTCTSCYCNQSLTESHHCMCNESYTINPLTSHCCIRCDSTCKTCSGPASTQCSSCKDHATLQADGSCLCDNAYFLQNYSPYECDACHVTCATCFGNLFSQCLSCKANAILVNNTCQCKYGFYYNSTTHSCEACSSSCAACVESPTKCTDCSENASLTANNTCVCDKGYLATNGSQCLPCADNCVTCNEQVAKCVTCVAHAKLINSACVCEDGYYTPQNAPHFICLPCNTDNCKTCSLTSIHCTSCNDSHAFINSDFRCVCESGYYEDSECEKLSCEKCDSTCKECKGPHSNQCTSCPSNATLSRRNECECNSGYYFDQSSKSCKPCSNNCATCQLNSTKCTSCQPNAILTQQSTCVCKTGYFDDPNNSNFQCNPCNNACLTCANSAIACTSCKSNATLSASSNTCTCNDGYYFDDGDCKQCHSSCKHCNNSNQSNKCIDCYDNAQIVNGACVCKDHFFSSAVSPHLVCSECDNNCKTCSSSATSCETCASNAHIVTLNGQKKCVCDDGWYASNSANAALQCSQCDQNCKTCSTTATTCVTCYSNATLNQSTKKCECDAGYFMNASNVCQACNSICKICVDTADKCTSCKTGFTYNASTNKCKCNAGTYYDPSKPGTCQKCDKSCSECDGGSSSSCSACLDHMHLVNKQCVCDDGYYLKNNADTGCGECHKTCATCNQPGSSKCLTCKANAELQRNGSCACIDGYTMNNSTGDCEICHKSCKTCSSTAQNGCVTCKNHGQLVSGKCNCEAGYFMNTDTFNCDACHASCVTCAGPLSTDCLTCRANQPTPPGSKGACVCSDGYYMAANYSCSPCHNQCATCNGPNNNQCLTCKQYASLSAANGALQGTCVCNNGYYMNNSGTCSPCDISCYTCANSNTCTSCKANATKTNDDRCVCNDGFYYSNGSCSPCSAGCATCTLTGTNCLTCGANQHRVVGNPGEYTCVCDTHYYISQSQPSQVCSQCNSTCKECSNGTAQGCTPCVDHAHYQQINGVIQSTCTCDRGYYASQTSPLLICTACTVSNCADCLNATTCNECMPFYVKQNDGSCKIRDGMCDDPSGPKDCHPTCRTCVSVTAQGCLTCYEHAGLNAANECPCADGYYRNSVASIAAATCKACDQTCATCAGGSTDANCTTCKAHASFDSSHKCKCDAGYYFDAATATCQKCNDTCATCVDNAVKCVTCKSHAHFNADTNTCTCDDGYYWNTDALICSKCNDSCKTCSGPASFCTSCESDSNLINNTCICKEGTYRDPSNPCSCTPCALTCKTCSYANQCDACIDHAVKNICDDLCSVVPHYYFDPPTNTAYPCHDQCAECTGPKRTDCTQCYPNAHLTAVVPPSADSTSNRTCECDDYYFYATPNCQSCSACSPGCKTCFGSSANQCTSCKSPLASVGIDSACHCPNGYYMDANHDCQQCNASCATCDGPLETDCLTCPANSTFDASCSRCPCNAHFYRDESDSRKCKPCDATCSSCTGSSSNSCTGCYAGAELQGSSCVCKSNYFYNAATSTCIKCLPECATCTNSTTCSTCVDPNATPSAASHLCVCNSNYYLCDQSQTCVICNKQCKECNGSNDNQCLQCYPNATLNPVTHTCTCDAGYYKDPMNASNCLPCSPTCKTCVDAASTCASCRTNATLINNQCICNDGFYYDNLSNDCKPCYVNCRHCSSNAANACIDCYPQQTVSADSRCVCSTGFYQDPSDSKKCLPCNPVCATCTGSSSSQCLTCTGANQIAVNGVCKCKPCYFFSNNVCTKCADRCNTCTSSNANTCSTCIDNASLTLTGTTNINLTCQCNSGYYYNAVTSTCDPCHFSCSKCKGPLATDCTACSSLTTLSNNNGLCVCKQGYYADATDGGKCKPCNSQCITCSGPNVNNCLTCSTYARLSAQNTCECSEGYYRDGVFPSLCNPCHQDCKTCVDNNLSTSCTSCRSDSSSNMYFFPSATNPMIGTCGCIDGFQFIDCVCQHYCRACHSTCKTCDGTQNTNCLTCYANAVRLPTGACKCSNGFYLATDGKTCSACAASCATCGGPSNSECLSCPENGILSNGKCTCKSGYYQNGNVCSACPLNCAQCTSGSSCQICNQSYTLCPTGNPQCQLSSGLFFFEPKQAKLQLQSLLDNKLSNVDGSMISDALEAARALGGSTIRECHERCLTCSGPHQNECKTCHENAVLDSKTSTCICTAGYFLNQSHKCMQCASACESCTNDKPNMCFSCITNASMVFKRSNDKSSGSCFCDDGYEFDEVDTRQCVPLKKTAISQLCQIALKTYLPSLKVLALATKSDKPTMVANQQMQLYVSAEISLDFQHSLIPLECSKYVDIAVEYEERRMKNNSTKWQSVSQDYLSTGSDKTSRILRIPLGGGTSSIIAQNNAMNFRVAALMPGSDSGETMRRQFNSYFTIYFNAVQGAHIVVNNKESHNPTDLMMELLTSSLNSVDEEEAQLSANEMSTPLACDIQGGVFNSDCFIVTDIDVDSQICSDSMCDVTRDELVYYANEKVYLTMRFVDSSETKSLQKRAAMMLITDDSNSSNVVLDVTNLVNVISQTTSQSVFEIDLNQVGKLVQNSQKQHANQRYHLQIIAEVVQNNQSSIDYLKQNLVNYFDGSGSASKNTITGDFAGITVLPIERQQQAAMILRATSTLVMALLISSWIFL